MKFSYLLPALTFALRVKAACKPATSLVNETNTYDYIVVGSGPGGGTIASNLARSHQSVLLIEAGDDESADITTQILALNSFANLNVTWHFFVRHSDDIKRTKRYNLLVWRLKNREYWVGKDPTTDGHEGATMLGVFYPRGATLGGSAIVNAAATFLPSDSDWEYFDKGVRDGIWSGKEMRRIFERIEHNNYLRYGTSGHGFYGWLHTNIVDRDTVMTNALLHQVFKSGLRLIGLDPEKVVDYLVGDANYLDASRDQTEGLWALPFHATANWRRFSPRDSILMTKNEAYSNGTPRYPLHLQLNSLATKILFENCGTNSAKPRAIGVEYLQGKSIYRGDPRHNSSINGTKGQTFARKEVIVAGGTFSSPQLLQLSGIGPRPLLQRLNISIISDLPGVGRNLQDNYELPIVGQAKLSLATIPNPNDPNCSFGASGDPCVELWKQYKGPYARGGSNSNAMLFKSKHAIDGERDFLLFSTGNSAFRGFRPVTNQSFSNPPNTFSWSTVKMHPQNGAGVIQIKSSDPQDTPDINMNYFAQGADTHINAILDTVAWGRRAYFDTEGPVGPVTPVEPPCPATDIQQNGYCKDTQIDRQWIEDQTFGHHPTSSCSVGPHTNPLAVLDTRLRVRGVERLRVVDASAFPRCPGAFPAVATFMLSERATELVLEDAATM